MLIRYLVYKEFLQMWRNRFLKVLALIYPVVIMCVVSLGDEYGGEKCRGGSG